MILGSLAALGRTLLVGVLAYAALVVLLRVSGKRTLSKMNAFDWVVTVAFGSTLATMLLSKDVALAQGVVAFAVLVVLQLVITWLSVRSPRFARFIKAEPTLLVHRGRFLDHAMKRERVMDVEILAAVRRDGLASVEQAEAVVLETDGSFSVIERTEGDGRRSSLANVERPPE